MAASSEDHKPKNEFSNSNTPIYEELGVEIAKDVDSTRPGKAKTFLNPKMRTNRELILLCLAVKVKGQGDDVTSCLDAFAASGIQALQWKKHFGARVIVTANDVASEVVEGIRENCRLNGCGIEGAATASQSSHSLETTCKNANVLLHERAFKFIHLDPFGTSVNFLDAAFSNLPNGGILSVTSTDISAFLGKCPQVTMRHYNGHMTKCEYLPELACRLIIASLVRAAVKCHKGLEVLFVFAKEHFILTVVRVRRGYKKADQSLRQVQRLLHCNLCEERVFIKDALLAEDNMYTHLPCTCYKSNPGKTASLLGPVWSSSIFDPSYVTEMLGSSKDIPGISAEVKGILEKAQGEATMGKHLSTGSLEHFGKREGNLHNEQDAKVRKIDSADVTESHPDMSIETGDNDCNMRRVAAPEPDSHAARDRASGPNSGPCGTPRNIQNTDSWTGVKGQSREKGETKIHVGGQDGPIPLNDQKVAKTGASKGGTIATTDTKLAAKEEGDIVPFFYTVVRHCPDKGHWPRMSAVIDTLRARGHQAAQTIFHHHGVRTTATLEQFIQTLRGCTKS